jgi:hypothetical protein
MNNHKNSLPILLFIFLKPTSISILGASANEYLFFLSFSKEVAKAYHFRSNIIRLQGCHRNNNYESIGGILNSISFYIMNVCLLLIAHFFGALFISSCMILLY